MAEAIASATTYIAVYNKLHMDAPGRDVYGRPWEGCIWTPLGGMYITNI